MIKADELRTEISCLNKAAPNEPIFVLRANDPIAPQAVRLWAAMAFNNHEDTKVVDAHLVAAEMEKWRKEAIARSAEAVCVEVRR